MKAAHLNQNQNRFMPRRGFVQNRLQNFGVTMVVMGASFGLYYLGLFGGVSGPLQPERIGDWLAAMGFSDRRLLVLLLSFMVIAITWNWVYNAFNRLLGRRDVICVKKGTVSHFVWAMWLTFSAIVFYLT